MSLSRPKLQIWTRDEYHRMAEIGLFQGRRVELVQGEIVQMPAMKNSHAISVSVSHEALRLAFGSRFWIRQQLPRALGKYGEPEPDLAVVEGAPRDYTDHPTTALLLLEIADASLRFDRKRKGAQYAFAQIADYWIVNLLDDKLEVYRDPAAVVKNPRRSHYRSVQYVCRNDIVSPLALPDVKIKVADLFP